jgi:hypothetical protein
MWKTLITVLSPLALCAGLSACFVGSSDTGHTPAQSIGTLTTSWTLDHASTADVCVYYHVDRVNVVLVDDLGAVVADEEPFCEDFGISHDLATGAYTTEVTLLDLDGYALSDTVVVHDVRVVRDTEVFVDVDFPDAAIN